MNENKRIAKNSVILYIRLVIYSFIGIWTSRIVLHELGAADFGLYAIVGGIIALLNFISTSMLATTYRFIAMEIGKKQGGDPNRIFNTSLAVHIALAILFLIFAETGGAFYINHYLNIPHNKIPDALFVLHFSIISTCVSVISVPFQGLIIAKENFMISSLFNIIQALLSLGVAISLTFYTGNKLHLYAAGLCGVILFSSFLFYAYCRVTNFEIIRLRINRNWADYKTIISYNFWILVGTVAFVARVQGSAVILNLFFGTLLNAAYGIANQLNNFVMYFSKNLNQAAVPQITKNYSGGDTERSMNLVYSITKYAFFLMLLPTIPIIFSIDQILAVWLKEVPKYTREFVIIMLINGLLNTVGSGFDAAIQATGKIRNYQVTVSGILLLSLAVTSFLFYLGLPPFSLNIVFLTASITTTVIAVYYMKKLTTFSLTRYYRLTLLKCLKVSICAIPLYLLRFLFPDTLIGVAVFTVISIIMILASIYLLGLEASEKSVVNGFIKKAYSKFSTT
jgi:O-antigen/teichoic acid export membrane protein